MIEKSNPTSEKLKKKSICYHSNNESELYDIVNVTGIIYNLGPVQTADKNENKFTCEKPTCKTKSMTYPSQYLAIWLIKLIIKV